MRKHIYECDEEWIKALKLTFKEYKDKIQIIDKFVSDKNNEKEMTLDKLQESIEEEIDFIKMDIEGAEIEALNGAKNLLKNNKNLKLVLCCYHRQDDEKNMRKILKDFDIEVSKGYLLCWTIEGIKNLKEPYLKRGILRVKNKNFNKILEEIK